ncbi:MAG: hypothetical protein A3B66_04830 [Alphaproteobacteria bacterium RIFCSPHIGHO2_02_FULL_46_13]|nr:MAG: hypothetical protein A3B66_04830 [Alphaproteobacteria bacterium RIFCSPHIGHO2_02_FULL_46_13]
MLKSKKWIVQALFIVILFSFPSYAATSLPLTINLSDAVTVTGTPRIAVNVDGTTRYATYTSGSGTSALTFTYSMVAGDVDLDGITVSSPIDLNGGTITDLAGNNLSPLTFTPPNTTNVKINYPSIGMDFVADADGRYTVNGTAYNDLPSFLSATGGTFSRTSTATYFDSTGTLQTAATNAPRFDYDPSTLAFKGLLLEEGRTNGIRNNTMFGTVAGTPGTRPTNWFIVSGAGISTSIIGTGQEDGIDYIDIRFFGTSTGVGYPNVLFELTNQYAADPGAILTASSYVRVVGGSLTNMTNPIMVMNNVNSSNVQLNQYVTSGSSCNPTSAPLKTQRCKATSTASSFTNAATAYVFPYFQCFIPNAGLTVDVTLRFGLPQIEVGSFATTPIKTSTTALTRQPDNLTIPTGAWYTAAAGTIFATYDSYFISTAGLGAAASITLDDGTANSAAVLRVDTGRSAYLREANVGVAAFGIGGFTANSTVRHAMAYAVNNVNASANGTLGTLDTSATIPTFTTLRIGVDRGAAFGYLNGHIQKAKYYPSRTSDSQLQLLTQ